MFATDASANQGNSAKGTKSSRPPSHSQKPCREMFVTSTSEVALPCCADDLLMGLNHFSDIGQLSRWDAVTFRHFNGRLDPEFRLAVRTAYMNVHARFLA